MANTIKNSQIILREMLRILHNKLNFIGNINRSYDNKYAQEGTDAGATLQVRLPNKYTVTTGRTFTGQNTSEQTVTITRATQKHVGVNFFSDELTNNIDESGVRERVIEPAMAQLASDLEADAFNMVKDIYNAVGTPGTTPASMTTILQAGQKMTESLAPRPRKLIVNPAATVSMVNALSSLFHSGTKLDKQYREGMLGENTLGFDWYENPLIPVLTTGSDHTTVTINGASQTGATLTIAGGNFKKGDIFTIANVYAVHPETKTAYDYLQQFTVTADATTSVGISPSIITSGAYQNVDSTPANGAVVTVAGTASTNYPMNIAFHRDAFAFVTADLKLYPKSHVCVREMYDGISMRLWLDSDIRTDELIGRVDVLYGYKTIRPELACRVWG